MKKPIYSPTAMPSAAAMPKPNPGMNESDSLVMTTWWAA